MEPSEQYEREMEALLGDLEWEEWLEGIRQPLPSLSEIEGDEADPWEY
jgi:hypothetical protein